MRWWDGSSWTETVQPGGSSSPVGSGIPPSANAEAKTPWYKRRRWWAVAAVVFIIAVAAGGGGGDDTAPVASEPPATAEPSVTDTASAPTETVTVTSQPAVTVTQPAATVTQPVATVTAAPAPDDQPPIQPGVIPDVVGLDLQSAQDLMQAAGFYNLSEEDATGAGRLLLFDRNWTVVEQTPEPGTQPSEDVTVVLRAERNY